jgi:hypothetical protein
LDLILDTVVEVLKMCFLAELDDINGCVWLKCLKSLLNNACEVRTEECLISFKDDFMFIISEEGALRDWI